MPFGQVGGGSHLPFGGSGVPLGHVGGLQPVLPGGHGGGGVHPDVQTSTGGRQPVCAGLPLAGLLFLPPTPLLPSHS